jgi:hypothetical protein
VKTEIGNGPSHPSFICDSSPLDLDTAQTPAPSGLRRTEIAALRISKSSLHRPKLTFYFWVYAFAISVDEGCSRFGHRFNRETVLCSSTDEAVSIHRHLQLFVFILDSNFESLRIEMTSRKGLYAFIAIAFIFYGI